MRLLIRAGVALLLLSGWLALLLAGWTAGGAVHLLLVAALVLFPWRGLPGEAANGD
jgi:hypothetical protein